MSSAHKEREDVYVILRADLFHGPDTRLEDLITAKEVVRSQEIAQLEVDRLNAVHADKQVRYWYAHSGSFLPDAQQAPSRTRPDVRAAAQTLGSVLRAQLLRPLHLNLEVRLPLGIAWLYASEAQGHE